MIPVVSLLAAPAAWAQTDAASMAHLAAANQLGVLEYCQSQGAIDGTPIASEKTIMTHLPASSVATTDAEATGKSGTLLAPNGAQTSLSQLASTHSTTISALCKQMGSSVQQSAAAFSQNGGGMTMPTMPSMPGGMSQMPSMPNMPQMPGMPATTTGSGN